MRVTSWTNQGDFCILAGSNNAERDETDAHHLETSQTLFPHKGDRMTQSQANLRGQPMKAYALKVPPGHEFARLTSLYVKPQGPPNCLDCGGRGHTPFPENLWVEWDGESNQIGDFTSALARIVTTKNTFEILSPAFPELVSRDVRFQDHLPEGPRQTRKKSSKRIDLPEEVPSLGELETQVIVPILFDRSSVEIERQCECCGRIVFKKFTGMEVWDSRGRTPRQRGKGLYFTAEALGDANFFRPQYTGFLACTPYAKEFIETRGFTNIGFIEIGEIVA